MHQCEAGSDLLLFFIGGAASCVVPSFFPSCRAWLSSFSWVHNLPFFTHAFTSICKPYHIRKYCGTVESSKQYTYWLDAPRRYRFSEGTSYVKTLVRAPQAVSQ